MSSCLAIAANPTAGCQTGQAYLTRSTRFHTFLPKAHVKAAPWLKLISGTLSLVLPVASSSLKVAVDEAVYKSFEKELDSGQKAIESVSKGLDKAKDLFGQKSFDTEHGEATEARGALLCQLHSWLKQKAPKFGGLVSVRNKRQEFLWVHQQFESEY